MFNWHRTLENYLNDFDALHVKMGEEEEELISDKNNQKLITIIEKEKPLANRLLVIISFMYVALFVSGIVVIFSNPMSSSTFALLIGGGGSIGLIGIIKALESVWRAKSDMDLLLMAAKEWSPEDTLRLAKLTYYNKQKK